MKVKCINNSLGHPGMYFEKLTEGEVYEVQEDAGHRIKVN